MNKKRIAAFCHVALTVGILTGVGMASLFMDKPTVSEYERRELAAFPEFSWKALFSGSFTRDIDTHYADTFPNRDRLVRLAASWEDKLGLRYDEMRIHENPNASQPETPPPPPSSSGSSSDVSSSSQSGASPEQSSSPGAENSSSAVTSQPEEQSGSSSSEPPIPSQSTDGEVVVEQFGSILTYKGQALAPFGGSYSAGKWYADTISGYQKALGDSVKIYNLLVPTNVEFALPEKYRSMSNPQKPMIDYIYSQLDPRVKTVDAYSKIAAHTDEYLYFATDHHWTALGAYYAYTAFAETAGFTPKPLSEMETHRIEPFIGSMYSQTQDPKLLENPDYVDYYITEPDYTAIRYQRNSPYYGVSTTVWADYAKGVNSYSVFLHGDFPLTAITTQHKNGRKIMVVKESFGNAFAPYLMPHYEEIYVVDARYFQLNAMKFIQEKGINEILFINNIFAANTAYHINNLALIQTQPDYVPPPATTAPPETSTTPETTKKKPGIIIINPSKEEEKKDD